MSYLLITESVDGEDVHANLVNLQNADQRNVLRTRFRITEGTGESAYGCIFVIDASINDGAPTLAKVETEVGPYGDNDYATVNIRIHCDERLIHWFSYDLDGRA